MSNKNKLPPQIDPDVTISGPLAPPDPDQTVSPKMRAALEAMDPEDTIKPMPREPDPDATFSGPIAAFDPDATIGSSGSVRRRANPFAPKALPEALQANLAALGGLNSLIAFANPILSAVPQIAAARNHPDPALLKETLQDLIEAFEAGASKIGVQDEVLEGAVYALCCMADDAAASTPWGGEWITNGLLRELRGEANGSEGFFVLLEAVRQKPEENAELLELIYICLALGFQGRYRNAQGGKDEVERIRAGLHALVTRRRARPADGLSERWRGAATGTAPRAAVLPAATQAPAAFAWRAVGGAAIALLVLFTGYRMLKPGPQATQPESTTSSTTSAARPVSVAPQPEPALSVRQQLEKELAPELKDGLVALTEDAGRTSIGIRHDRQFASGNVAPDPGVKAILGRIAEALERVPGRIVVTGYADSLPVKTTQFQSNRELSAARAKAAAAAIATKVRDPKRITSEGAGEASPIAPNDTEANRAKNRRVAIVLGPQP